MSLIKVEMLPAEKDRTIEDVVDDEIREFGEWFSGELKNDPLMHVEKAILKTFLAYKLKLVKKS